MALLIAGVGYQFMRDLSVGPELVPVLAALTWPPGTEVIHMHFGPVHAVHWLTERPERYRRVVFLAAVPRGRPHGRVYAYRWDRRLPDPAEIQARVAEGVTGVVDLDHTLIVAEHFGALPADVRVVEVEPVETGWGEGLTPEVAALVPEIVEAVRRAAGEASHAEPRSA